MTISVEYDDTPPVNVVLLDCDSISQAKDKILDKGINFDSHMQKMISRRHAATVPEPIPDLNQVKQPLSATVPNAVTMEKSSCDTTDCNSMCQNAFECESEDSR